MDKIQLLYQAPSADLLSSKAQALEDEMMKRRSVRAFAPTEVPQEVVERLIRIAASAPSGANKQPWHFVAVRSQDLKDQIKEAAEAEEYTNYHGRMSPEWLEDLKQFETDWHKPFLSIAPWLIVVFKKSYELDEQDQKHKNYYVNESVGISLGFLLMAIHQVGLTALTHTPSPMNFLEKLLQRPSNEKAYMLIPVGYPQEPVEVPNIKKKTLAEIAEFK